jgi:hypothetical protein
VPDFIRPARPVDMPWASPLHRGPARPVGQAVAPGFDALVEPVQAGGRP